MILPPGFGAGGCAGNESSATSLGVSGLGRRTGGGVADGGWMCAVSPGVCAGGVTGGGGGGGITGAGFGAAGGGVATLGAGSVSLGAGAAGGTNKSFAKGPLFGAF